MRGTVAKRIRALMDEAGPACTKKQAVDYYRRLLGKQPAQPHPLPVRHHHSTFMGFRGVGKAMAFEGGSIRRVWQANAHLMTVRSIYGGFKGSEGVRPPPYAYQRRRANAINNSRYWTDKAFNALLGRIALGQDVQKPQRKSTSRGK